MPIIIVLLATLVAFFLAGPFIAVAVLLIGLAILFPNVVGIVAAIIGFAMLSVMLSVKLDVSPGMLILIIIGILGLLVLFGTIIENSGKEKMHENRQVLDKLEVKYTLIEMDEKIKIYSVTPNTDEVWEALKIICIEHGTRVNYEKFDIKENFIVFKHQNENKMKLIRRENEIEFILENLVLPPKFMHGKIVIKEEVSRQQNTSTNTTEDNLSIVKDKSSNNNIDDLIKLSNLLKEGLVTEDEYQSEKSKLLNRKGANF